MMRIKIRNRYYKWIVLIIFIAIVFVYRAHDIVSFGNGAGSNDNEKPREKNRYVKVTMVIDGDSIKIEGGNELRYIGIDAPEYGERFFMKAKKRNKELVEGEIVKIEICRDEPRDKYGRILAWVYKDDTFINGELLKEGLAYPLIIPPCGLEKLDDLIEYYKEGRSRGTGLWKGQ